MDEFINNYGYVDVGKLADYANNTTIGLTANDIMRFPKVDVQPVKHGKWLKRMSTSDSLKCSVCGNNHEYETIYCPHCGARMDLKDGEE